MLAAAKAARWTAANIPGANEQQMYLIFSFAFERGSRVTLGGSRVRAYHVSMGTPYTEGEVPFKDSSDLDVGYNRLNAPRAQACGKQTAADMTGWLPVEEATIVPGNTIGGKVIESPEEFFQRSGERSEFDLKRKNDGVTHYYPSGSVTFDLEGNPTARPPGK